MKYKFLEHTADIKFRAYGKTLQEVFENSVLAFSNYVSGGRKIPLRIRKKIVLKGEDKESLLYCFLDELIFLLDAEFFIAAKAKVKIKKMELEAVLEGDDSSLYKDLKGIKAATYAEMYTKKTKKGFEAQAVLDV